jgi:hypothetical protein
MFAISAGIELNLKKSHSNFLKKFSSNLTELDPIKLN